MKIINLNYQVLNLRIQKKLKLSSIKIKLYSFISIIICLIKPESLLLVHLLLDLVVVTFILVTFIAHLHNLNFLRSFLLNHNLTSQTYHHAVLHIILRITLHLLQHITNLLLYIINHLGPLHNHTRLHIQELNHYIVNFYLDCLVLLVKLQLIEQIFQNLYFLNQFLDQCF